MTLHYKRELIGCVLVPVWILAAAILVFTSATLVGTWFGIAWGMAIQVRNSVLP